MVATIITAVDADSTTMLSGQVAMPRMVSGVATPPMMMPSATKNIRAIDGGTFIDRPSNADLYGSDWNWAEAATEAWLAAARVAGLAATVVSTEVPDLNHDAAIVAAGGRRYVVTVHDSGDIRAVPHASEGTRP